MKTLKSDLIYHLKDPDLVANSLDLRPYFLALSSPGYEPVDEFTVTLAAPEFYRFRDHFKINLYSRWCVLPEQALAYGCSRKCSNEERVIMLMMALRFVKPGYARMRDMAYSEYYGLSDETWRTYRHRLRRAGIIRCGLIPGDMSVSKNRMVTRYVGSASAWVY